MNAEVGKHTERTVSGGRLWYGLAAGPLVWAAHLAAVYAIHSLACHNGAFQGLILGMEATRFILLALTLLAAAAILIAGWMAYGIVGKHRSVNERRSQNERRLESERGADAERLDRTGFMAWAGVLASGLFLAAVLATLAPMALLPLCGRYGW